MPAYKNKTQNEIEYSQAPSGFINVEKWEPPFAKAIDGFGFMGVVAEDSQTGQLQCHVCGKWFEQLPSHYSSKHKMSGDQYRKKFGLLSSTALKSKKIRLAHSATITRLQKEGKMQLGNSNGYGFHRNNSQAGNRRGKPKAMEAQNRFGVCDLQIATKIIALGRKIGKTPTLVDIKNEYGGGIITIMHNRYGSYISYCRKYLKMTPGFSNYNPQFGTTKKWRDHLLEIGRKKIKEGKPMTVLGLFGTKDKSYPKESRYIYKYFKNFNDYKKRLLK